MCMLYGVDPTQLTKQGLGGSPETLTCAREVQLSGCKGMDADALTPEKVQPGSSDTVAVSESVDTILKDIDDLLQTQ